MANNGFTLTGKLYRVFETEIKDSKWYSRKFIIILHEEYDGSDYYQYVLCELRGETKCAIIDRFELGWNVKVHCNMRGAKYNPKDAPTEEKYFVTVDAWKIENMNAQALQAQPQSQPQPAPTHYGAQPQQNGGGNNFNPSPETIDDLPF